MITTPSCLRWLPLVLLLALTACGGSSGVLPPGNVSVTAYFEAITPTQGPVLGGTLLTLTGEGFREGAVGPVTPNEVTVLIGSVNAVDVTLIDDTTITCRTPEVCGAGNVDVTVLTTQSTLTLEDAFEYAGDPNPACAPPEGHRRILFTRVDEFENAELWSMEPDGSDPRLLTNSVPPSYGSGVTAQWSPGRDRLLHYHEGQFFIRDADGSNPVPVTTMDDGLPSEAAWCPDESCLALVAFLGDRGYGLFVWDLATSDATLLVDFTGVEIALDPTWSPDGSRLAYRGDIWGIFSRNADGSDEREIVPGVGDQIAYFDPDWGINGIVFSCTDTTDSVSGTRTIWRVDPDGSNLQQLTYPLAEGDLEDRDPCWSPDGTQIAFLRRTVIGDPSSVRVFVMDADGSNAHVVPGQTRRAGNLDW